MSVADIKKLPPRLPDKSSGRHFVNEGFSWGSDYYKSKIAFNS